VNRSSKVLASQVMASFLSDPVLIFLGSNGFINSDNMQSTSKCKMCLSFSPYMSGVYIYILVAKFITNFPNMFFVIYGP
jgi:hypothetical protein